MLAKHKIFTILKSPWIISLLLLAIFLATSSYKYGWDDQHLEIPLLKSLIDSSLYSGDYYIESLKKNFSSFFYPILAKLISVDQIPTAYFYLYLISRYFLFFWIYKLWLLISKDAVKAFGCSAAFILVMRVPEFLYRTFSHQEFALAIIMAGIYYFYKERFLLSAFILGVAANIHALYSLFPMFYMGVYLLFSIKKRGVKPLIQASAIFFMASLPFIVWTILHRFMGAHPNIDYSSKNWIELFILACPQNFIFPAYPQIPFNQLIGNPNILLDATSPYIFLFVLFLLNLFFNQEFSQNRKSLYFCLSAFFLIGVCFIFTYLFPARLMIDLNLARNTQYLLFILFGYTTLLLFNTVNSRTIVTTILFATLYPFYKLGNITGICISMFLIFALLSEQLRSRQHNQKNFILFVVGILLSIAFLILTVKSIMMIDLARQLKVSLYIIIGLIVLNALIFKFASSPQIKKWSAYGFVLLTLTVLFVQFTHYKKQRVFFEQKGGGFWQLQRNWEDMQKFVKNNTPKDAMILVPYNMEMGGFRILSERKIICSYRDCGIIGFDYNAAEEWQRRVRDIEPYKIMVKSSPIKAIQNSVTKYNADYVVFMNYIAPKKDNRLFSHVYTNGVFTLVKVNN